MGERKKVRIIFDSYRQLICLDDLCIYMGLIYKQWWYDPSLQDLFDGLHLRIRDTDLNFDKCNYIDIYDTEIQELSKQINKLIYHSERIDKYLTGILSQIDN
jgi:hypothetical protein